MSVALVTDSTAYLPEELRARGGITVIPLHVVLGGQERSEGIDVTATDVAQALRAFTPVSTSRPAPAAFLEAYRAAADAGATEIVSVHLSSGLSSTIGGAELAAAESPVPVTVVDSRALGMVMGYAVLSGSELAASGASAQQVADHVRRRCEGSFIAFYVDTLEYLRRGGRIGTASALLGSALAIKPILALRDGAIVPLEKVRTTSRSIARLEELAGEHIAQAGARGVGADVAVHHLDSADRAEKLAERLRVRVGAGATPGGERGGEPGGRPGGGPGAGEVCVVELGAVVGSHVGPGTIAVAVVPRDNG